MPKEPFIKAHALTRHFGQHTAVQDLEVTVHEGEVLGLLGPNGAGKSTTMQMLSGCLAPSKGQIIINGIDLLDSPKAAKRSIGYLAEKPPLHFDSTVDEYLYYCARLHRIPKKKLKQAVDTTKQRCGLVDLDHRLVGNLSKGYQQRAAIAQAIVHDPAVIILDEATVGLDPIQIREIRQLIHELGRQHAVILSTHILAEVQATCDRVQIMVDGQTVYNDQLERFSNQQDTVYRLGCANPPDLQTLTNIMGDSNIEELAEGLFRVNAENQTILDRLTTAVVEHHWQLTELSPLHPSLEQIFMDLVYQEPAPAQSAES